jgi:hypothetical protein
VKYARVVEIPLLLRHLALSSSSASTTASQLTPATFAGGFSAPRVQQHPLRLCSRLSLVLLTRPLGTSWLGMSLGTTPFSRPWMAPRSRPTSLPRHSWHDHHRF